MADALICAPLPFTVVETGNQTAAGPASNLANDRMGRAWQMSGTATAYVVVDLGSAIEVDLVALLATNAANGDTMRVRAATSSGALTGASPSGVFAYDSGASIPIPMTADGLKRYHRSALKTLTPTTARYWRIDIATSNSTFTAGRLVIGKMLMAADGMDYGWSLEVVDLGSVDQTQLGGEDVTIRAKVMSYRWTWSWLTEAEARGTLLDVMLYAGNTRPVLVCLNHEASDAHNVLGFGRLVEGLKGDNFATDLYEASFALKSRLVMRL